MKIAKLRAIAKKAQSIELFETEEGVQWIRFPGAAYPLYGLPRIYTARELIAVLDLPEDAEDEQEIVVGRCLATFCKKYGGPDTEDGRSTTPITRSDGGPDTDDELATTPMTLMWRGVELEPLPAADGRVYLIDEDMLAPVRGDMLNYYYRAEESAIAVKAGLSIVALLAPIVPTGDMVAQLRRLTDALAADCDASAEEETEE